MHKNYILNGTGILASVHHTYNNKYIHLPFILQPNIKLKKIELFCDLDFYGAYWLSGIVEGYAPNVFNSTYSISSNIIEERVQLERYKSAYDFNKEKDNRFEFGYIIGFGSNYYIKDTIKLFFKIDLWKSLSNQHKGNTLFHISKYNESMVASLGFLVHF